MNKFLKEIKNIDKTILVIIIISTSILSFVVTLDLTDELWNFANCYKMFNGYKIYRDINIIITPLFFYISQIFLKIFSPTIFAFKIYNIFIYSVFLILIYKVFEKLNIPQKRGCIYTLILLIILSSVIMGGANYNVFALIPVLIAILSIITNKDNPILLGSLLFITFMLKQNVFVFLAIGIFFYKLLISKDIKKTVSELFKIYIVALAAICLFFVYLYIDNNLYNFINFCFLGIAEFGSNNLHIDFVCATYLYISVIAIIFSIILLFNPKIKTKIDDTVNKNIKCLLSFGSSILLTSFPIANYFHMTLGSIILLIEIIYLLDNILIKEIDFKEKTEKIIYITTIIFVIIYMCLLLIGVQKEAHGGKIIFNTNGVFYGSVMSEEMYSNSKEICEYIENKARENIDVKVLSYTSNLYMIQINKNNGVFDLPFKGNLGREGENGLINQISQMDNTLILLQTDEENIFWQESKKAREYIICNYEKIGEIQGYSIYSIEKDNYED